MQEFDFTLPGLGKPKSSRPERVAEAIHKEMSILLQQKVRDSKIFGVAISKVQVAADLKHAKVYCLLPKEGNPSVVLKGMERARGFFRSHLAKTLNLRYTPNLVFYCDEHNKELERLDHIFAQINTERTEKE
ncbi:MAG: 30S ribosome-binding factor RbfA [Candidatus Electrothrix sp. AR3]|nr:30S ribosome-binding factor RbfA [Candidatus Electrothrix sp. AR3]